MNIILYISAVLIFTVFDVIGYHYILTKKETIKPKKKWLVLYRILQGAFWSSIIYYLNGIDLKLAIAFVLSHWFGVCDMLYYVFTGQNVWNWKGLFWLWWTPYGLAGEVYEYQSTGKMLYIFSTIGVIISIGILLCL